MTGAPPTAPPPSDTIERLPEDFWDTATAGVEAAEGAVRSSPIDEPPIDEPPIEPAGAERGSAPERTAAVEPSRLRPSGAAAGVAVLQRLFPGRVLGVEPHASDEGVAGDAIASGDDSDDDSAANASGAAAPDDPPDDGGLESGRSRR